MAVGAAGTGMATRLAADGQFAFAGAPEQAELLFERAADGISASLEVEAAQGPVVVELAKTTAKKSGRRRAAGGGNTAEFEGLVRSASATEVVVFTSKKVEQAIAITPQTIIRRGKTVLTPADLTVDQRVHVKALRTDTGFNASLIIVQAGGEDPGDTPERKEFEGLVVSSSAEQLVIVDSHAVQQTFVLTATTDIRKGNTPVLPADIQPGWRVHVKATTAADGVRTATRVIVQKTSGGGGDDDGGSAEVKLSGRVTAVAATSVTVETDAGSVTVQTDASTKIEKKGDDVPLASIVAGDKVKVEGTRVDATTVLAKEIEVR